MVAATNKLLHSLPGDEARHQVRLGRRNVHQVRVLPLTRDTVNTTPALVARCALQDCQSFTCCSLPGPTSGMPEAALAQTGT